MSGKKPMPSVDEMMRDFQIDLAAVEHGWKLWPATATQAEQEAAFTAYLHGAQPTWYPHGYREEPIITEGKLKGEK